METECSFRHSQVLATCPVLSQLDPVHTTTFQLLSVHRNFNVLLTMHPDIFLRNK